MKRTKGYKIIALSGLLLLCPGCSEDLPADAEIAEVALFPDYEEVTVPANIAPLNFKLPDEQMRGITRLKTIHKDIRIPSRSGVFNIPMDEWKEAAEDAKGDKIDVSVYFKDYSNAWKLKRFHIFVSKDSMDNYLTYRRIFPGYRMWGEMGIYQRTVDNFVENPVINNRRTGNSCVNCHSFCRQDGSKMLFHQRSNYGGTYLVDGSDVDKISVTDQGKAFGLAYPYWHPSGKYIAFSHNDTRQDFHYSDRNRIEVYDKSSDLVIYHVEEHRAFTVPLLSSPASYETFPAFTPDGKSLIFCSADSVNMPDEYRKVRYHLLRIAFDPEKGTFGQQVDTLYNARKEGRSISFPRVSPDGKRLLYAVSDYGNFSIWHRDADLRMLDLRTGETDSLSVVNSDDVESYHSWSSNGRWFVFASRRLDGQFTRPFIAHVDEEGKCSKPFLLPQYSPDYYEQSLFSFNIPEFSRTAIRISEAEVVEQAKEKPAREIRLERQDNPSGLHDFRK